MAVRRILVDDLDDSTANVTTVRFTLDGVDYEIDLSEPNRRRLDEALTPFTAAARRLPKRPTAKVSARHLRKASTAHIRDWWLAGVETHTLPAWRQNGQIPRQVRDAYDAAHRSTDRI
jgi:hypothetical protein